MVFSAFGMFVQAGDKNFQISGVQEPSTNTEGDMTEYTITTSGTLSRMITIDPDTTDLWFTEYAGRIGKMTQAGVFTEYPVTTGSASPFGITIDADTGDLWFTEYATVANHIGQMTQAGVCTEYDITTASSNPYGITIDAGTGDLWFTETAVGANHIAKMTQAGVCTEYDITTASAMPRGITIDPDTGDLWFCEYNGNHIAKMTQAGVCTEYDITTAGAKPIGITIDPDTGNLWFTEEVGNHIGKMTQAGVCTEYDITTASAEPYSITMNPVTGDLWFTEYDKNKIGKMTQAGVCTEYTITTLSSNPWGITIDTSNGNLFFVENSKNKIGKCEGTPVSNPDLNDDCAFTASYPETDGNYSEHLPVIDCRCHGTGTDLSGMTINVNYYLYYYSNHTSTHLNNDSADIALDTWYSNISFNPPDVASNQVCHVWVQVLLMPAMILSIEQNGIDAEVVYGHSGSFTIYDTPIVNDDCTYTYPEGGENYTGGVDNITVYLNGTGSNLDFAYVLVDVALFCVANESITNYFGNYDAGIDNTHYNTWANLTAPEVTESGYYRIRTAISLGFDLFSKGGNQIMGDGNEIFDDTIYGLSGIFMINPVLNVTVITPNGGENYTVGVGDDVEIEWEISGGLAPYTSTVFYTVDNGTTWHKLLDNSTDESYTWDTTDATDVTTFYCYIYVMAWDVVSDVADDSSNDSFTLFVPGTEPIPPPPPYEEPNPILLTVRQVGNWMQGDSGQPTAYVNAGILVSVRIQSDYNLRHVIIYWQNVAGSGGLFAVIQMQVQWSSGNMVLVSGDLVDGVWEYTIPAQDGSGTVTYYIVATDSHGNVLTTDKTHVAVSTAQESVEGLNWNLIFLILFIVAIVIVVYAFSRRRRY
jgi:virginiamycin B lyase